MQRATTWAICAALMMTACGDAGGGSTAGDMHCSEDWCKGDPVGAWSIREPACLIEPIEVNSCPDLQCDLASASASGILVLPVGGQGASAQFMAEGSLDCAVPTACLGAGGCAELSGTCTATAAGCDCEVPLATSTDITGTWMLDTGLGILRIDDPTTKSQWATSSYCAGSNTLDLGILSQRIRSPQIGLVSVRLRVQAAPR